MFALTVAATIFFLINRFVPSFTPFGYRISENPGTATLAVYLSLIAAALFLCLGVMGEYLALVVREVKRRPMALVAETTYGLEVESSDHQPLVSDR